MCLLYLNILPLHLHIAFRNSMLLNLLINMDKIIRDNKDIIISP